MEQQQQQSEEVITDIALIEQDKSTVKILQEDDLKTLKEAVEKIKTFKRKYSVKKLTVTDIDSKEQKEKLRLAIADVRTTKTSLEKDKKDKTLPYRNTVAYINSNFDKVIEAAEGILDPLKAHKKEVDELVEAKEKEAEIQAQARLNSRVAQIINAKMVFDGEFYSIGSDEFNVPTISLGIVDLQTMTDGVFENVLGQIIEKNEAITKAQAAKDEAARIAKEEEEAEQERQRVQRIKDQEKIDADKKALEDEKAEMRRTRIESRCEQLEMLGVVKQKNGNYLIGTTTITVDEMGDSAPAHWSTFIAGLKTSIEESKAAAAEKERLEKIADEHKILVEKRIDELVSIGLSYNKDKSKLSFFDIEVDIATEVALMSDENWVSFIQITKPLIAMGIEQENKRIADEKAIADKAIADKAIADKAEADALEEKNRIEALNKQGDAALWNDFISRLKAISYPEVKSNDFQIKINDVRTFIDGLK